MTKATLHEPADVLSRVKRGLSGYVSYLAACEMNGSFSEYVLYEPILRILTARQFVVQCEAPCPGMPKHGTGDHKRLDFVASSGRVAFALEVKWAKASSINVAADYQKLAAYVDCGIPQQRAFLCVFGRKSHIGGLVLTPDVFREHGDPVFAEFGKTRYGCRVFELGARRVEVPSSGKRARRKPRASAGARASRASGH